MKTLHLVILISSLLLPAVLLADRPSGHGTPEGIACDAVQAYADCDPDAWLKTLIRPVFGDEKNRLYQDFKEHMVRVTGNNKQNPNFVSPRIIKVFKARNFTLNGPGSMAYALHGMIGNKFVDIVIETGDGRLQVLRYHVLLDKDDKWYFAPRPDLAGLLAMGLNDESPSEEILWENP